MMHGHEKSQDSGHYLCGGLAWAVDHELFAAVFVSLAVVAGSQAYRR